MSTAKRSRLRAPRKIEITAPAPACPEAAAPNLVTPSDVQRCLSQEHMHKLFHLGGTVDRYSSQIGSIDRDDANDELNLKLQQETLQRLQAEFALRRKQRQADRQQFVELQQRALRTYILCRDELSVCYGIDLSAATFDDVTGLIQFPPSAPASDANQESATTS